MKTRLSAFLLILLISSSLASGEVIQSGFMIMDGEDWNPGSNGEVVEVLSNILVNPGFESGALPPWTTDNWTVTGADFYSGAYSATDEGNFWVRQDFAPTDVSLINSVTMYSRQPDGPAFQAVDFYYSGSDFDEFLIAPGHDWTFINMTGQLRGVGSLQAIRIWGYSGGPPSPDITRVDDVAIDAEGGTPTEHSTWGRVKALYR